MKDNFIKKLRGLLSDVDLINDKKWGYLDTLAIEIRQTAKDHGWNSFQLEDWELEDKLPRVLALVHAEVSEALEAFRIDDKENFLEEMADVVIRVLDCVGAFGSVFDNAVLKKMEKNKKRNFRHGGKKV